MFTQHTKGRWTPGMHCSQCGVCTSAQYSWLFCGSCGTKFIAKRDLVRYRTITPTFLRQVLLVLGRQWPERTTIEIIRKELTDA